ncbi:Serrate RNA effector molecule [Fasciolopsis buskii]|uniref:Serrate RNA effector molecule n=1 Tax=Fasciolopsis buskii TaxID=27845 RepID=A0A8E0VM21_9TREM|nr:Serrate RNA effector molecule [Fasciolopsis buski]
MLYDATIHYDSSLSFCFSDVIWVCTLSDKKFRDPVYVKKHILNKHMEKVEAVKKDTALFFNNYLMDPMRPQLPLEPHISSKRRRSRSKTDSLLQKNVQSNEPTSTHPTIFGRFQDTKRTAAGQGLQYWPAERRFPSTSLQLFSRDHGPPGIMSATRPYIRMPYLQSRLPFHVQRGRYPSYGSNYPGTRQGFQRRPYVDLDAP